MSDITNRFWWRERLLFLTRRGKGVIIIYSMIRKTKSEDGRETNDPEVAIMMIRVRVDYVSHERNDGLKRVWVPTERLVLVDNRWSKLIFEENSVRGHTWYSASVVPLNNRLERFWTNSLVYSRKTRELVLCNFKENFIFFVQSINLIKTFNRSVFS